MALTEIEFELPAAQFELMGYPNLKQGQSLSIQLDTGVVVPDLAADAWFAVQHEPLLHRFVAVGNASYAFSGQIREAELARGEDVEVGSLLVECGDVPLRVTCAPGADGRLPYGTWETRYLTGYSRIVGMVEEDFSVGIGKQVGVTIWSFRRLVLTPGDPQFGQWHESYELPATPYRYDRILIAGRLHRTRI